MTQVVSPNLSWEINHNFVAFKQNWNDFNYYEKNLNIANQEAKVFPYQMSKTTHNMFFWSQFL